jgi:hypothetical protein
VAETQDERQAREEAESLKAIEERDQETERRLGADEYVVAAPYVTLKVKDGVGGVVVRGFNGGAVVKAEDIDEENLRHHVETRLVVPKDHPDAVFAAPAGTPMPAEPPNVPVGEGRPVSSLDTESRIAQNRAAADKAAADADKRSTPRAAARQQQADKRDS